MASLSSDIGLLFRIRTDNSDAKRGLNETAADINKTSKELTTLQNQAITAAKGFDKLGDEANKLRAVKISEEISKTRDSLRSLSPDEIASKLANFRGTVAGTKNALNDMRTETLKGGQSLVDLVTSSNGASSNLLNFASASGIAETGLAGLVTGVGIGIGIFATFVAGVVKVSSALFDLAKSASDYGSEFKDAQEITGLSIQTLGALRLAAEQGGKSFDDVTKSTEKFVKVLAAAREGNEKAQKTLNDLGVTSDDLETALNQAYTAIAKNTEGLDRMGAAQDAFGKSGAELLPIINAVAGEGGIEGFTKKAQDLATTLSQENVDAADAFGDELTLLETQAKVAAATFALQFAPQITHAMEWTGETIVANRGEFEAWGIAVSEILTGISITTETSFSLIRQELSYLTYGLSESETAVDAWATVWKDKIQIVLFAFSPLLAAMRVLGMIENGGQVGATAKLGITENGLTIGKGSAGMVAPDKIPTSRGSAKKGKAFDPEAEAKRQQREAEQAYREAIQLETDFQRRKLDLAKAGYETDLAMQEASRVKGIISEEEYANAVLEIKRKMIAEEIIAKQKIKALTRQNSEEDKRLANEIAVLRSNASTLEVEGATKVYEAHKKDADTQRRAEEERLRALDKEIDAIKELAKIEEERASRELVGTLGKPKAKGELPQGKDFGLNPTDSFLGGIIDGLGGLDKLTEPINVMNTMGQMLTQTFGQVADAVGNAVHSFVLFGTAGGSFRKFAAEVIASIAQMAVVQAVWELAQGFAMTALAWFTGNPKYAASATDRKSVV